MKPKPLSMDRLAGIATRIQYDLHGSVDDVKACNVLAGGGEEYAVRRAIHWAVLFLPILPTIEHIPTQAGMSLEIGAGGRMTREYIRALNKALYGDRRKRREHSYADQVFERAGIKRRGHERMYRRMATELDDFMSLLSIQFGLSWKRVRLWEKKIDDLAKELLIFSG
jgi:hypothetical protein